MASPQQANGSDDCGILAVLVAFYYIDLLPPSHNNDKNTGLLVLTLSKDVNMDYTQGALNTRTMIRHKLLELA